MTCGPVPDGDQVVHYVKPSKILDDGTIDGSEFILGPDHQGLSVNWLDYFASLTVPKRLEAVALIIQLDTKPTGRFAEWNVGSLREYLLNDGHKLWVDHDPSPATDKFGPDPSHCQIYGLPTQDPLEAQLVGDMIAESIQELHDVPRVKR